MVATVAKDHCRTSILHLLAWLSIKKTFPRFPVSRFPPLQFGAAFSSLAFSSLAFSAPPSDIRKQFFQHEHSLAPDNSSPGHLSRDIPLTINLLPNISDPGTISPDISTDMFPEYLPEQFLRIFLLDNSPGLLPQTFPVPSLRHCQLSATVHGLRICLDYFKN